VNLQHRVHLGPPRPGAAIEDAQRHWHERHPRLVRELPGLCGYVQNRPLPTWWHRLPYIVCAETWFASRTAEAEALAGEHYRNVVVPDEARILLREHAWSSPVTRVEVVQDGPRTALRMLAFGGSRERLAAATPAGRIEVLHLRRPPTPDLAPEVLSVWSEDELVAGELAGAVGGVAFVSAPVALVAPPGEGWPPSLVS
jgi:uncharacterized protein (TIGR02118 family)